MPWYILILSVWLVSANIAAVFLVLYDKRCAIRGKRRISEATLLLWAALSGCMLMYISLFIAHHKTRKIKFMLGIPLIFILEVAAVFLIFSII